MVLLFSVKYVVNVKLMEVYRVRDTYVIQKKKKPHLKLSLAL